MDNTTKQAAPEGDWLKEALTAVLIVYLLSKAIKTLTSTVADGLLPRKWATPLYVLAAIFFLWLHAGHPVPSIFRAAPDPRLDNVHWQPATATGTMYKWWQFGTLGFDTIMPVPACTHYDHAEALQDELRKADVLKPVRVLTPAELMEMSPMAKREYELRRAAIDNSTLDGRERCFMTPREEHLLMSTTMPYLTTDTMAPSLIGFVRASVNRDLLTAPSDGQVTDILVSRLGETFARVVAIVKQVSKNEAYTYTLDMRRVLLPLVPLINTIQEWYDDQVLGSVVKVDIDPCQCLAHRGVFRSGLYAMYDARTRKFSLLARMHISNRNENDPKVDWYRVGGMPFADYLNPFPLHVHRRLPEALQGNFSYPVRFQIAYYNLSAMIMDYAHVAHRVNSVVPHWLERTPDRSVSVDHVPLAITPIDTLLPEHKQWIEQDEVTACIMYCDRLEEAILKAANGDE